MTEETRRKLAALFAEQKRLFAEAMAKLSCPKLTGEQQKKEARHDAA